MRTLAIAAGTMLITGLLTTSCTESEERVEEDGAAAVPTRSDTRAEASLPDTTAEAVWAYLRQQDYRESWSLWPGKSRLYAGTEPHGMLLTTYVNEIAHEALTRGAVADLPAGSILVKENYMPDSTLAAATVMYRVDGYNPDHEDWLFAKYDAQGTAEAFGRAPMCQACHQQARTGYVYTEVSR
ncbi:MAG TPA: cytochrome P460 family protein [Longimicrobiales bacterium]|nr:cytochrome P460 family protein [Longimicrobiales bacterium]